VYSELIVLLITGKEDSDDVRSFLEIHHGEVLFRLIDIVLIGRDTAGKISYQMPWQETVHPLNKYSRLAGAFAETIFDVSREEDRRQLADAGLDPFFMCKVNQTLTPPSTAYLLYLPNERLIDSRDALEILGELQGNLFHTIFRPQVEEVLLKLIL